MNDLELISMHKLSKGSGSAVLINNKDITENGVYKASDDDADGYKKVTVSVPTSTLVTKNITQNGTYNASSDNADGYSSVNVSVPISVEVAVESGGYSGTGVGNEGQLIGPDDSGGLTEIRCRTTDVPYLMPGTYSISSGPNADDDIQFAVTLAALGVRSIYGESLDKYIFTNTIGGGWNPTGALTLTLNSATYVVVTIRKENNVNITPSSVGGYITIRKIG